MITTTCLLPWGHACRYALLRKRAAYFRRDTKTWIFTFCLPAAFVLVGLLLIQVPA